MHGLADQMKLQLRTFEVGQPLVVQGELGKEVFLIREGTCDVIVKKPDGGSVKVAERGRATSSARWRFRCARIPRRRRSRARRRWWPPRE